MGKGLTGNRNLQRKPCPDMKGREARQTSLQGIAESCKIAEARLSEEPGAVVPHAGICAGVGRVTALPTATVALCDKVIRNKETDKW